MPRNSRALCRQQIVGYPLLDFQSLNIGSGRIKQDFKAEMIHQMVETLVIYIYQLLDESEEEVENEGEIRAHLVKTVKNNLRMLGRLIDSWLQPMDLLFDAYFKGSHSPEILGTAFIMCSLENTGDMHKSPIDFTIDRLIAHHQNHATDFVKALKHAWNPLLDERLQQRMADIDHPALRNDMEAILTFRDENRKYSKTYTL